MEESTLTVGNKSTPSSKLQTALNEHGEQLDKLAGLFSVLETRLQPLRNALPVPEASGNVGTAESSSATVGQLNAQTNTVRIMQAFVNQLLNELEV